MTLEPTSGSDKFTFSSQVREHCCPQYNIPIIKLLYVLIVVFFFHFCRFSPDLFNSSVMPSLKASLDLSAEYLILTDVQRKVSTILSALWFELFHSTAPYHALVLAVFL